jgi:hypothetical protein
MPVIGHFLRHLFLKEGRPDAIHQKLCSLLDFILILRVVLGSLSDLSLALRSSQSRLQSVLLVLDGGLEGGDSFLTLLLLVVDHLHQVVELVLALTLVLPGHHLHVRLRVVDVCLLAKGLLQCVDLES